MTAKDQKLSVPPRRRRRKEARPGEIISAGIAEFEKHGFHHANLNRIAQKAGISKSTIYLYFSSKEALFLAAIEEHVSSVMGDSETDMSSDNGTTQELLTRLLRKMYDRFVHGEAQALFRILLTEGDRMPHVISAYHAMTIQRGSSILRRILERGQSRGEVRDSPVLDTPHVLIAPAVYFAVHTIMFKKSQNLDFDTFFDAHLDMIFQGILAD